MEKIHMFFRGQTVKVTLPLQAGCRLGKASMLKPGMAAAILTGHTLLTIDHRTKALMTILFRAKTTMASKRKAGADHVVAIVKARGLSSAQRNRVHQQKTTSGVRRRAEIPPMQNSWQMCPSFNRN